VLPGDDHLLHEDATALFDDCPGVFLRHYGTLRGPTKLVNLICWNPTDNEVKLLLDEVRRLRKAMLRGVQSEEVDAQ
jgi:hypothetical protein